MTHEDLKSFISQLDPNLTTNERIYQTVNELNTIEEDSNLEANIASMEKMLAETVGYQKKAETSQAKALRQLNSIMIKQAIAEAELEIAFERTNHKKARDKNYQTKRYLGTLNSLYGNEPEMQGFDKKSPEEQYAFYVRKMEEALAKFPKATDPDVSDTEIVQNYRTILELYILTFDVNSAKAIFDTVKPEGQKLYKKYSVLQNNLALLNGRAFLMASPYYSEIDYAQILRTPLDSNTKEALADHANALDSKSLKPDINMLQTLQENLKICREEALENLLPKKGEGTVEYFGGDGKILNPLQKDDALRTGAPLLLQITDQNGVVTPRILTSPTPFSIRMADMAPEEYLDQIRSADRAELTDLASVMEKSIGGFRGSSDRFKDMQSAFVQLYSLSSTAPTTQNLLSKKDMLEELLESANAYLKFKSQSRAGTDSVEDYSKLGKNQYEQTHINAALKMLDYAQRKLGVSNLLMQDSDFMARAATNEEALRNAAKNSTRKDIANLRATCTQRNPEPWVVREGGENVEKLHHAVGRDLRRLAELACLDRPLDAIEKAEVNTRMARAVALDLVRSERASNQSNEMGKLESAAAQNPEKFAASVAKSKPFQKAMDKMTPEKLKGILADNGIQTIRQGMLSQAVSVGTKPSAPVKAPEPVQPTVQSAPKV